MNHPYRTSNPNSLDLSLKDRLYLSGNPFKLTLYYIVCFFQTIGTFVLAGTIAGTLCSVAFAVVYGLYKFFNTYQWALIILVAAAIICLIASMTSGMHKEELKWKLAEANKPTKINENDQNV